MVELASADFRVCYFRADIFYCGVDEILAFNKKYVLFSARAEFVFRRENVIISQLFDKWGCIGIRQDDLGVS